MKFVIPASNVKLFARSVFALSKLGDEIYIEPMSDSVISLRSLALLGFLWVHWINKIKFTLRTVNSSRSAFSCFSFKRSFFTHFESSAVSPKSRLAAAAADQTLNTTTAFQDSTNKRGGTSAAAEQTMLVEDLEPFKCKIVSKVFQSKDVHHCSLF